MAIAGSSLIPFKEDFKPYLYSNIYHNFDLAITLSLTVMLMGVYYLFIGR